MYSGLGISCIRTLKETDVQYYSVGVLCTLDTLMLASKSFPLSSLSGELATFILAASDTLN